MSAPGRPTPRQIRRRRRTALGVLVVALAAAAYLVLAATVLAPVDRHGADLVRLTMHSEAVGEDLDVGGISMGGFGAYNLALQHPGRFCAVGGHSAALWFDAGETAPGAFDSAADFERNDVVEAVQADPNAFGKTRVWNDYGDEDPFRVYNEGFADALRGGETELSAHSWPGGHEGGYWDRHWPAYQRFYVNALAHCG